MYIHRVGSTTIQRIVCTVSWSQQPVGVMKTGNIMPRAGIEPTFLAFRASVLPLRHVGSLMSTLHPRPPVYVALYLRSVQTTTIAYSINQ